MIEEILKKDLRKISEEEFREVFEWLKEKTENFTKFPEEIFLKNNQTILILRCALMMTRNVFAKKVGINEKTLRHVESGRKQNRIKSLMVAKRWCKKITWFLQNESLTPNERDSSIFWEKIKNKQHLERNINLETLIKKKLDELQLPSDLREINEEKFTQLFLFLKAFTNNFKNIPPEILTARSDLLLILRCCLGLSRKELAHKINVPLDTIRHLERKKNIIKNIGPALRWIIRLQPLFSQMNVDFNFALHCFKRFKLGKSPDTKNSKLKLIKHLSKKELKSLFEDIKVKTNNFTQFPIEMLRRDPRIISVFRICLGLSIKKFSQLTGKDESHIRKWENLKVPIKFKTALFLSQVFQNLFQKKHISFNKFLSNLKQLHKFKRKEINLFVKNGLRVAENQKLNETEKMVEKVLLRGNQQFKAHASIEGIKRVENVDFLILSNSEPKAVIEVFKFSGKHINNLFKKAIVVDHKFQSLKLLRNQLKTIMCIHFPNISPTRKKMLKKLIETHLFNTDNILINEFDKLIHIIL